MYYKIFSNLQQISSFNPVFKMAKSAIIKQNNELYMKQYRIIFEHSKFSLLRVYGY